MRRYLELFEISEASTEELDFIRIDITEWSSRDIEEAIRLLIEHARETYENYVIQIHDCYHEEGESCIVVALRGAKLRHPFPT